MVDYLNNRFIGMTNAAALLLHELGIPPELISVIINQVDDLNSQEYLTLRLIRSRLKELEGGA